MNILSVKDVSSFLLCVTCFMFVKLSGFVCEEIFGCGGFVKSNFSINYSKVEIKLYTKHGSLKYQTDCAPNNGYYLIPLYDKGDYVLKIEPPHGWEFKPSSVVLHVDGATDMCSRNQDINFIFMGFTVSGKVVSFGQKIGPTGIKLSLKKSTGEILHQTESAASGSYQFAPVLPGKYIIEATHNIWMFDQHIEHVEVSQDNIKTENKVVISGFDVRGHVFSEGEPIQGVHFLLFSKGMQKKSLSGCKGEAVKSFNQKRKEQYICHVTSQGDGGFLFPSLPTGNYVLVPFHKGEHIEFDVSPSVVEFEVNQDSLEFSESFKVEGFSVSGRVLEATNGKGIPDAEIYVNDKLHTVTEANGIYHLENMRAGLYEIKVKAAHIFFEPVSRKVTPNTPQLPEIFASKFSICGHLHVEKYPQGLPETDRFVVIKSVESGSSTDMFVDGDGNFCTVASAGKYVITPSVSGTEQSRGLQFVPAQHAVNILHSPVLDIVFTQFLATLQGQVKCVGKCGALPITVSFLENKEIYMETVTTNDGKFQFAGCLPGKYILNVQKDDWCFHSKSKEFTVIDTDISSLELQQSGFQAVVTLSHSSSFKVKYPSGVVHSVQLQNAKNVLCLPELGIYDFLPIGCHLYKSDIFKFDAGDPVEIEIKPVKHLVTGNILTERNVSDVKVLIQKNLTGAPETIQLEEPVELKEKFFRYTFSVFVEPNTELEIKVSSSQLLFRPTVARLKVSNDCIDDAVEIIGKSGLFINGSVTPALENVRMKILDKKTGAKLAEVLTHQNGTFTFGPLDSDNEYTVTAEKDGYFFTSQGSLANFRTFKLAEIIVEVNVEDSTPLPGVLLSLSGGVDYRKNSLTQKNGKVSFTGLSPGQYFLRPMLKEFQFQPSTKMIDIKEGTRVEVRISGKRVAYSLFGVVNSLTGESEVGVALEAVGVGGKECHQQQEEAASEQGGSFRIRGLRPGCQYRLSLKKGNDVNQHIERATPDEIVVEITDTDITNIRIIVFRHFGQMDVSGSVVTSQDYLSTLKVRLHSEDNPDQVLHSISLGKSGFFFLPSMPVDNKMYTLRMDSSLSNSAYTYDSPFVTFCANTSFRHFTFTFQPRSRSVDQEVTQGSILALPLAVLVILVVYNYNIFFSLAMQIFQTVSSLAYPPQSAYSTEYGSNDNVSARRKTKIRRMQ